MTQPSSPKRASIRRTIGSRIVPADWARIAPGISLAVGAVAAYVDTVIISR